MRNFPNYFSATIISGSFARNQHFARFDKRIWMRRCRSKANLPTACLLRRIDISQSVTWLVEIEAISFYEFFLNLFSTT